MSGFSSDNVKIPLSFSSWDFCWDFLGGGKIGGEPEMAFSLEPSRGERIGKMFEGLVPETMTLCGFLLGLWGNGLRGGPAPGIGGCGETGRGGVASGEKVIPGGSIFDLLGGGIAATGGGGDFVLGGLVGDEDLTTCELSACPQSLQCVGLKGFGWNDPHSMTSSFPLFHTEDCH